MLQEEGFIRSFEVEPGEPSSVLVLGLKYGPDGEQVIRNIERISKPGRRVYSPAREIPRVLGGLGVYVLTTPQGVVSDRVARERNAGGEILCKVY